MKLLAISSSVLAYIVFAVVPAFAHIIVTPHQVGTAATQDFTVSVPNEKDNPVVAVRLLIPDGLRSVVPNTVPGWTITTKTQGSGDNATVTEIDWNGGSIPVGQQEEFVFQTQVPAQPTTLNWKAYQTYSNGTVVSWDVDPKTLKNMSDAQQDQLADTKNKGEYSTTTVINDLTESSNATVMQPQLGKQWQLLIWLGVLGFILSLVALIRQQIEKKGK